MKKETCLVDSCTTNFVLRKTKYFQTLTWRIENILNIARRDTNIVGYGRATIVLPMGRQVTIKNVLLYPDFTRTLLSYRDIHKNGLHVITHEENNEKFLHIINKNGDGHDILERIHSLSSGLYYTCIKLVPHVAYKLFFQNVNVFTTRILFLSSGLYCTCIKHVPHVAYRLIFQNANAFMSWHECIGHPGIGMMRKIIGNSTGHNLILLNSLNLQILYAQLVQLKN
jgi:hypothetical protein